MQKCISLQGYAAQHTISKASRLVSSTSSSHIGHYQCLIERAGNVKNRTSWVFIWYIHTYRWWLNVTVERTIILHEWDLDSHFSGQDQRRIFTCYAKDVKLWRIKTSLPAITVTNCNTDPIKALVGHERTHELIHNLSIMIAEAPPPPLQMCMPAIPFSPRSRLCTRWPTIRAPDIPIGWPRETEPEEKGEIEGKDIRSEKRALFAGILCLLCNQDCAN